MASACRGALGWRLLVLVLLAAVVNANLREFKQLMRRAYLEELDDEDLFMERQVGGSGSGSGSGTTQPEVCDEAALAAKCAGVCERAHCRDYPEATCRPNNCEDCTPVWSVDGREVANCTGKPLQCPGLWTPKGRTCYRVQNRYGFSFKAAQKYCLRQGGHLVSLNSQEEQNQVSSLPLLDDMSYWTSGYRQASTRTWVWQQPDGDHRITWTNWNTGEPNDSGYEGFPEDRIAMKQNSRRWRWNDDTSFNKRYPICEAVPEKIQTHCDSKPCLNGGSCTTVSQDMYKCECGNLFTGKYCELYNDNSAWNHHEGHLYLVVSDYSFNRQDATAYCAMHNAYLVSINTQEESDFLKAILDKRGVSDPTYSFYTGGYKAYVSGSQKLQWADGTAIGFKDWGRGEPNRSSETYIMFKFYTETNKWAWNDTPANWLGGFICEKQSTGESRRNLVASHNKGMLRKLFVKKWTQPDSTMEY